MAPAQRHGDISGARDMCVSSYTLARSVGDLPSQIDALRAMDLVLIRCAVARHSMLPPRVCALCECAACLVCLGHRHVQ